MPVIQQIIACENKLLEAMKNSDTCSLEELLHDSLIFQIPTGQTITKQIDIENYSSGRMSVCEIAMRDQNINALDDEIAVVSIIVSLKARYSDQPIEGMFQYLRVWKNFNNSWKVIAGSGIQIK
jgi:hypothetical protein